MKSSKNLPKISPVKKKKDKQKINVDSSICYIETKHIENKSYYDHNITLGPISSQDFFKRWSDDRKKLSDNVEINTVNNIFDSVFLRDRACKGCLGTGKRPYVLSESCTGCQLLSRLFKRGEEGKNKTITIQGGEMYGRELVIRHYPYSLDNLSFYEEETYSKEYGIRTLESLHHMSSCEQGYSTRIVNTTTYGTNSFISNYILISCILEQEMKLSEIPGIPIFRFAYECGDGVILIDEKIANYGNLDILTKHSEYTKSPVPTSTATRIRSLKSDVASLLLMQLVMNLSFLNNYDFTHGEPSLNSIVVTKELCEMKYEHIKLECPFTLHIIPSGFSSMTININDDLLRFFYKGNLEPSLSHLSEISKIHFKVDLGDTTVSQVCVPSQTNKNLCDNYKSKRILTYNIGNTNTFDLYTRNMGIALFPSSFDTYAFFVSFMAEEAFYQAVINDEILIKIWKSIWREDEYENVMFELVSLRKYHLEHHVNPNYFMIKKFLSKFYLRCDGLQFLWGMLKTKIKT